MRRRSILLPMFALMAAPAWLSAGSHFITYSSTIRGVTVAVTAGNLSAQATVWDFAVVLRSADGKNLSDDLINNAVLVDPLGKQYKALVWEGAKAHGAHRAGVLKFIAVKPRPDWIELRISRPGETKPRSFSWLLGNGLVASRQGGLPRSHHA